MANRKATEPHDRDTVQGSSEDSEHNNFRSTTLAELIFNGEYHTRYIKQFGLSATEPEYVHKLRAYINAILDWGRTKRLPKIQRALDSLLFKSCTERSAKAKARPSPSVEDDDLKDCGRECKHRRYG